MVKVSPTNILVNFCCEVNYNNLPKKVVHETKRLLLDSIGVALASPLTDRGKIANAFARSLGGNHEATILGFGNKVSCLGAAFANGEMINDLDYDARIKVEDWTVHVTPFVVPSVLAVAEREGASGKDLILAVALAHEVGARILYSVSSRSTKEQIEPLVYGYSSAAFGGTAGVCSILGFDQEKTANSFGVACHMIPVPTAGKWRLSPHSSIHKYCIAGWQNIIAITATELTELGYYSDETFLDGERGFWRMYGTTDNCKWDILTKGLGKKWYTLNTNYKLYPCCAITHAHLDAFSSIIKENDLEPDEIQNVVVKGDSRGVFVPLRQNREIKTHLDAQFSIYYGFAAVAYGLKPINWQDPAVFEDTKITKFIDKVTYEAAEETRVIVKARGKTYEKEAAPRNGIRITDDDLKEKFRTITSRTLQTTTIENAIEVIMNLEELENVRDLMKQLSK